MYRVSPFTYLVEGLLGNAVGGSYVTCASNEYLHFDPPSSQTCSQFMDPYISQYGGYLESPNARSDCSFCITNSTDSFLAEVSVNPNNTWRNFGIMWAYIIFNVFAALFLYWLFRVPKNKAESKEDEAAPLVSEEKEEQKIEKD